MQTDSEESLLRLSGYTLSNTNFWLGHCWESTLHCLNIMLLKALLEGRSEVRRNDENEFR